MPDGVNFKQQMRFLLLWSFAVSLRKTAFNSDFIWIIFMILYIRGAGEDNSKGVHFENHKKLLSL